MKRREQFHEKNTPETRYKAALPLLEITHLRNNVDVVITNFGNVPLWEPI